MKLNLLRRALHRPITRSSILAICSTTVLHGQLVVTDLSNPAVTPAVLAQEIVGPGITISNVQFTNPTATSSAGKFTGGNALLDFNTGIILSSGSAASITGPNNVSSSTSTDHNLAGDADLDVLAAPYSTTDATILEFDFVPTSSKVSFQFVFASEEYNEYVDSQFNDVFGFYINGVNRALVGPSGDPVTINTVNYKKNTQLYLNNDPFNTPLRTTALATESDGLTKTVTASATVIPNAVNHVQFKIADTSDYVYDSWVVIRAASFQAGEPVVVTKTAGSPTSLPGAANTYTITLTNPGPAAQTVNEIEDFLPFGFVYTPGSSSGATSSNPAINGRKLLWTGPFIVPANGTKTLTFGVSVAPASGIYYNSALARGNGPIIPTGDTAPVTVSAAHPIKWTATFQSLGISGSPNLTGYGSPVVAPNGTTFVATADGSNRYLIGVRPNGTLAPGFPVSLGTASPGTLSSSPTLGHDGKIYALSNAVYSVAYKHTSQPDGTVLWRYPSNPASTLSLGKSSAVLDSAGNVYFVDEANKLYGLTPTGTQLWAPVTINTSTDHQLVSSPVIGRNGLLYVVSDPSTPYDLVEILAINAATGVTVHQTTLWNDQAGGSPIVLPEGDIAVTSYYGSGYSGNVTILSPTLSILGEWTPPAPDGSDFNIKGTPIVGPDQTLFLGTESADGTQGRFYKIHYAYDVWGNISFSSIWTYANPGAAGFTGAAALSNEGWVAFADTAGEIHFLRDYGSQFLAEVPITTTGVVHSSPAIAPDGTIYVNDHNYGLVALTGKDPIEPRTWSSWRNGRTGRGNSLDASPQATLLPIPATFGLTYFVDPANPTSGFASSYGQVYNINNNQAAYGMGQGGPHNGVFELYQGGIKDLGVLSSSATPVITAANDRHVGVGYSSNGTTLDGVGNQKFFPLAYYAGTSPWAISADDASLEGINIHGIVTGNLKTNTVVQAPPGGPRIRVLQYAQKPAVWENGVATLLPDTTPAYYSSYAYDINASGVICGDTFNGPVIWKKGSSGWVSTALPNSASGNIGVRAINNAGVVVGWGIVSNTLYGSVWIPNSAGVYTQYLFPDSQFEDINNFGVIVGSYQNAASVWQSTGVGTYSRINLNGRYSDPAWSTLYTALTINDSNYIGGYGQRNYVIKGYILTP